MHSRAPHAALCRGSSVGFYPVVLVRPSTFCAQCTSLQLAKRWRVLVRTDVSTHFFCRTHCGCSLVRISVPSSGARSARTIATLGWPTTRTCSPAVVCGRVNLYTSCATAMSEIFALHTNASRHVDYHLGLLCLVCLRCGPSYVTSLPCGCRLVGWDTSSCSTTSLLLPTPTSTRR